VTDVLGTIEYGGRTFVLTHEDALWCGRMMIGEEGPALSQFQNGRWKSAHPNGYEATRAVVGSMIRRFVQVGAWSSLTKLLRGTPEPGDAGGYSQPIRFDDHRVPALEAMTWEQIPDAYRRAILDMFTGRVALGARTAIHFANREFTRKRMTPGEPEYLPSTTREGWRLVPSIAKNVMVSTSSSRSKPEVVVTGSNTNELRKLVILGAFAAIVVGGATFYLGVAA
jgi:hypothetical protein